MYNALFVENIYSIHSTHIRTHTCCVTLFVENVIILKVFPINICLYIYLYY